jgi:GTPase SAR1 family protein
LGGLVVFDITNRRSFENVRSWISILKERAAEEVQIILVGNKSDLRNQRVVSQDEAEKQAALWNIRYH